MTRSFGEHRVIVNDQQDYWREFATDVLSNSGFEVQSLDKYDASLLDNMILENEADRDVRLIIVGCAGIRSEEIKWIKHLVEQKLSVVVLCNSLSRQSTRSLFLLGVLDVTSKHYDAALLIELVRAAIDQIGSQDGYRLAARGG